MFKYAPQNLTLMFLSLCAVMIGAASVKAEVVAESTNETQSIATVEKFIDEEHLLALSTHNTWQTGEILTIVSQNPKVGTIAFVEVVSVLIRPDSLFEIKLALQRQSRKYFVQKGDYIRQPDLSELNPDYIGTTDLLIRDSRMNIANHYRPLVHQGFVIGDTAQTLFKKEFIVNYFGNLYYGLSNRVTVGTLLPVNFLGRPNMNFRVKIYDSESTTLTSGLSFVRLVKEDQASLNLNFYWDNISSDALISHTFIGLGLISWDKAGDAAALKYLTSSSIQTGYEVLLDNWNRFLIGPSYNFEKKALGGYLSHIWIVDQWHLQLSINSTDVTKLSLNPTDGYYGFFDIYWRF